MSTLIPNELRAAPETIGNYVIERVLARGSMGTVFVAHHTLTHARVALKVLRLDMASDDQAQERFLREVRAAARIGHEGIVRVHDAGTSADGRLYLAMELLEGSTLEERLALLPGERLHAAQWLLRVLDPLAAAHAQGIVHRDLKPANVFIARASGADDNEQVKLLDFGLARDTRDKSVTQTGIALGTPYYMSPEQATQPRDVGPASDVWSFGVMLYEVLCGAMPFDGETLHAVVIRSSTTPHVPCAECAPELGPELSSLVDACLDKDASKRPRDAGEVRTRLAQLLASDSARSVLQKPVKITPRTHSSTSLATEDMPFAATAISIPPPELIVQLKRRSENSAFKLWLSALAVLALSVAGFLWLISREAEATSTQIPQAPAEASEPAEPNAPKSDKRKRANAQDEGKRDATGAGAKPNERERSNVLPTAAGDLEAPVLAPGAFPFADPPEPEGTPELFPSPAPTQVVPILPAEPLPNAAPSPAPTEPPKAAPSTAASPTSSPAAPSTPEPQPEGERAPAAGPELTPASKDEAAP